MLKRTSTKTLAAAALSLLALSAGTARAEDDGQAAAGKAIFEHTCAACHFLAPGKAGFGPNLHGVYMRKAGSTSGFAYSQAMSKATFVWDENNLRSWIADNEKFVPGTRMRHVAITDRAQQDYLIAFLKQLK